MERSAACANCETPLRAEQRFCGHCGQRAHSGRLTMRQIGHDVLHALTHADHSIFSLIRQLAYRPGRVAREYVDGRRKKYFGPFPFVVISVGLASFMIYLTGVHFFSPITESGAAGLLQRHVNVVIVLQMPFLAGWCVLLFWTSRLNYAEHLVLAAYTSGFRMLFLGLITTPFMYFANLSPGNLTIAPLYYGLWMIYFAVAAVQFYRGNGLWTVIRAAAAAALAQLSTILLIYLFIIVYAHTGAP
jgi:hypothetical protein